jgi:iron complex transport system ATP-binding protein
VAVLSLAGVDVAHGRATLLHDVDWVIHAGERWVVLGPNGAGKTTLLQVAAAVVPPAAGSVHVLGESVVDTDLAELRSRIGLASASLGEQFRPAESVLDVVLTAAYGVVDRAGESYDGADEARAKALLSQVGCRALVHRRYGSLSEGERKRVHIARALMSDPELLLLDEPAAGLDLGAREALLRRLARLCDAPDAPVVVLVTHHVEEIPPGVTHALLLRDGRVVASGPVADVLVSEPLSSCFGLPLHVEGRAGRWAARMTLAS